jgi:hypothetical protein
MWEWRQSSTHYYPRHYIQNSGQCFTIGFGYHETPSGSDPTSTTTRFGQMPTRLTCKREVPGFNLCWGPGTLGNVLRGFPQPVQPNDVIS